VTRANDDHRRREPRLSTRIEGLLRGRSECPVIVLDLSATGCLVQCAHCPDEGTILDLQMSLDERSFCAKVRVAEVSLDGESLPGEAPRYLAGLEFLGLPIREETQLLRFLDGERRRPCARGR
jgi:hypothetical protein